MSKAKATTAIKDHMLFCDHLVSLEDFKILASSNSEFHLKIKESLLILRDKPELNKNEILCNFTYLINAFSLEYFICTRSQCNNDCFIISLQCLSIVSYYLFK